MPVRFIIGRAGAGKTHWCLSSITASLRRQPLGPAIFYLLPRQATFTAEKELTCNSGLPGFARAEVLSLEVFAMQVLEATGGIGAPRVSAMGRRMILGYLLRQLQPKLTHFQKSAGHAGLAARLENVFAEMDRCDLTPHEALARAQKLDDSPANQRLRDKLTDLAMLYTAYDDYLGSERLDPQRRLKRVLDGISDWPRLHGATIYLDGFLDYTRYERRLIVQLAKVAAEVNVTVLGDPAGAFNKIPDEFSGLYRSERGAWRLRRELVKAGVRMQPPIALAGARRFTEAAPALRHVERVFFTDRPSTEPAGNAIKFVEAADRRAEVNAAARIIRQKVLSPAESLLDPLRYRDVMILMRRPENYESLIVEAFAEHDIPMFFDRRRGVGHHPLLQLVKASLDVVGNYWDADALQAMMKCGLCRFTDGEADMLDDYVRAHRIRGRRTWVESDSWHFWRDRWGDAVDIDAPKREAERELLGQVNELRQRIVPPLTTLEQTLTSATTVRQIVAAIYDFIQQVGAQQRLARWIQQARDAGREEEALEHEQLWRDFGELMDEMCDVLGDQAITLDDFQASLESALESFDLAIAPPTLDQVLIGSIDRTRIAQAKVVLLLGFDESSFPSGSEEDPIIDDAQRRVLSDVGIELEDDSIRRTLDESLLGYLAVTRASHELVVVRSVSDDRGWELEPSAYWRKLQACVADAEVEYAASEHLLETAKLSTPRQAIARVLDYARTGVAPEGQSQHLDALYEWLRESDAPRIAQLRRHAWGSLSYLNAPKLNPRTARQLFPSPLPASASSLQSYASCPYKHYATFGLGLLDPPETEPTAMDLGNLRHMVLEHMYVWMNQQNVDIADADLDRAGEQLGGMLESAAAEIRQQVLMSSARARYLLSVAQRDIMMMLKHQQIAAKRSNLRARKTELGFGLAGTRVKALSISLHGDGELRIRGRIDRLDADPQGNYLIVDYKLSGGRFTLRDLYDGVDLQLPVYLLLLAAQGRELVGRDVQAAAAVFWPIRRWLKKCDSPEELPPVDSDELVLNGKPRGVLRQVQLPVLDQHHADNTQPPLYYAKINKSGSPAANSDLYPDDEFELILKFARQRLTEIGVGMRRGNINVTPWRRGKDTACARCSLRSVCRFNAVEQLGQYRWSMGGRERDIMQQMRTAVEGDCDAATSEQGETL